MALGFWAAPEAPSSNSSKTVRMKHLTGNPIHHWCQDWKVDEKCHITHRRVSRRREGAPFYLSPTISPDTPTNYWRLLAGRNKPLVTGESCDQVFARADCICIRAGKGLFGPDSLAQFLIRYTREKTSFRLYRSSPHKPFQLRVGPIREVRRRYYPRRRQLRVYHQ